MGALDLSKIMNNIFTEIYTNQKLCKLLYYDSDNPFSEIDLVDTSILYTDKINRKLYPYPFAPDVTQEQKSFVSIIFRDIHKSGNLHFKPGIVDFYICSHIRLWDLDLNDGLIHLRPFKILEEVDRTFNRNRKLGGIGKDLFEEIRPVNFNENFSGMIYCLNFGELS